MTTLKKVLGRASVNLTTLQTIVVEIEAILNDRPLTHVSSDVIDEEPLTPAHLLYGRRITARSPHQSWTRWDYWSRLQPEGKLRNPKESQTSSSFRTTLLEPLETGVSDLIERIPQNHWQHWVRSQDWWHCISIWWGPKDQHETCSGRITTTWKGRPCSCSKHSYRGRHDQPPNCEALPSGNNSPASRESYPSNSKWWLPSRPMPKENPTSCCSKSIRTHCRMDKRLVACPWRMSKSDWVTL